MPSSIMCTRIATLTSVLKNYLVIILYLQLNDTYSSTFKMYVRIHQNYSIGQDIVVPDKFNYVQVKDALK